MRVELEQVVQSQQRAARAGLTNGRRPPADDVPRRASVDQREARLSTLLASTGDAAVARVQLERLLGGNDLVGIAYLERGMRCARAVCRIHLRDAAGATAGFGTGFLVAPGVIMTNHHVIQSAAQAAGATAEFDYELDLAGRDRNVAEYALLTDPAPIAVEKLDFCLAAVSTRSADGHRRLDEHGWLPLDPKPGKAFVGEYLTIIQHPGGERKQVCVRENKLIRYEDAADTLWYQTDTVAGSSGSPVFNNSWQVVALHHSGVPKTDAQGHWLTVDGTLWDESMDESRVAWIANEGIRISRILALLRTSFSNHPLAVRVLERPVPAIRPSEGTGSLSGHHIALREGELTVTIPVRIAVRVGEIEPQSGRPAPAATPPATAPVIPASDPAAADFEAVVVDQSNYDERPGYDPDFLGARDLCIPLPRLSAGLKRFVAPVRNGNNGELRYWTFSVILNKARKLAFFTAANVDASLRPWNGGRSGDRWYVDNRVDAKFQLDQGFYGKQREFEVDRSQNPFDRGHLVRRLDAQWGADSEMAARNGNDSFHFTNCSPQHWQYNQGAKRWLGLEDYVINRFAGGRRACVFNGPVFDAPLSTLGPDGRLAPRLGGSPHRDPKFGSVAIPKLYFKIVACARGQGLGVAAFLMSQEDVLRTMGNRLRGLPPVREEVLTDAEAKLYQVRVSDIEKLTGLNFGPLSDGNGHGGGLEALAPRNPRPIDSFDSLRL